MAAARLAAPAHADVDTDFANRLHAYGIYGPRDENAWLAKITCKRLTTRVDEDASSAKFLKTNLARTTSTQRLWQFLIESLSRGDREKRLGGQLRIAFSVGWGTGDSPRRWLVRGSLRRNSLRAIGLAAR